MAAFPLYIWILFFFFIIGIYIRIVVFCCYFCFSNSWLLFDALNYQKTRAAKAAEAEAECKSDGWEQFNIDSQSQQRRNATWHLSWTKSPSSSTIELIKPPPPPPSTNHDFVNIFLEPYNPHHDAQTLQLFPLRNRYEYDDDGDDNNNNNDSSVSTASHNNNVVAPCQFFEFLPLKGSWILLFDWNDRWWNY